MTHYRMYLINLDDKIIKAIDLDCWDDGEAVAAAKEQAGGSAAEIWQGARCVQRLRAEVPRASA